MQRVYGTAWSTQEELDHFLWRREEAKKRDHRKLGVQLDLFSFHDVSPGAAFWHPKGWRLYQTLRDAMREIQARRGYQEIYTPPLVHKKLWEQSGHWDLYRDNMFLVESEDQTYSLKPMNCPESTFIYRSKVRSYREFPLRLSEYGVLHRAELSGVRSGLTRVRHFYTDDAHIYVTPAQIQDEILALMGEVTEFYSWFGLEPMLTFGTKPEKALGDEATWRETEAMMLEALKASGVKYRVKEGDGAFYAPKIDIQIEDALGREWQTATIQVDRLMLPERFDLHYIDENGERQRPVAIHRAILGSLERFIGVITEHFAGAFPFWCAPVQAIVIPIADRHNEAASSLPTSCGRRASGSRSTTRRAGCRTRSASRRSRRCRTCSCSAIARSRHERLRRGRGRRAAGGSRLGRACRSTGPGGGRPSPDLTLSRWGHRRIAFRDSSQQRGDERGQGTGSRRHRGLAGRRVRIGQRSHDGTNGCSIVGRNDACPGHSRADTARQPVRQRLPRRLLPRHRPLNQPRSRLRSQQPSQPTSRAPNPRTPLVTRAILSSRTRSTTKEVAGARYRATPYRPPM